MSDSRVYRDGNKMIKVYLSAAYEYVEQAYYRQKFVYKAGLCVPAVYGIRKINDIETALEMEYIEGKPLVSMYEGKSGEMREKMQIEAMKVIVKLQCQMNRIDASESGLPGLTDFYENEIKAASYLSEQLKKSILNHMKNLDKGKSNLCHGDIHPYNILFNGDRYWIIDWEDASKGDPAADACMVYFYSVRRGDNEGSRLYLKTFCEKSGISRENVLEWLPVIAGVQINLNDNEDPDGKDREFILKFIKEWYREHSEKNEYSNMNFTQRNE